MYQSGEGETLSPPPLTPIETLDRDTSARSDAVCVVEGEYAAGPYVCVTGWAGVGGWPRGALDSVSTRAHMDSLMPLPAHLPQGRHQGSSRPAQACLPSPASTLRCQSTCVRWPAHQEE